MRVSRRSLASRLDSGSSRRKGRLPHDGAREGDALLLAAGELARAAREQVVDADARRRPRAPRAAISRRRRADHPQRKGDVLEHASCADRARSSGTPSRRCARPGGAKVMSAPSSRRALVATSSPAMMRRVVDLPEPEGPSSAKNSPGAISRSMPRSAVDRAVALDDRLRARRGRGGSSAAPALDRAERQALHDLALREEAEDDHRQHGDEGRGGELRPLRLLDR